MRIILAGPRGFCAGVNMAIEALERAIAAYGTPLYAYHEIVHNKWVVDWFRQRGVVFVGDLAEVPEGEHVLYSAHGVSPEVRQLAAQRGLKTIDATCPLVTKVHMEAIRYGRQGYHILLVGHAGHDEVVGTVGEAPGSITIVDSPEDVAELPFKPTDRLVYLTQTTLSMDDANRIINAIKQRFPTVKAPPSEDICYATTNRQEAVRDLAVQADLVLVVGSRNSSNSLRLTEIAQTDGKRAFLVDDVTEIDHGWFKGVRTVLVTAGASAPEDLVQGIIANLLHRYGGVVEECTIVEEDMHFELPVSLRVLRERPAATPVK
jgi:4-hydroxy-3-methylbut-2-en-1-yl diphosphate reductase